MQQLEEQKRASCDWLAHHRHGWQFGEQGVIAAIVDAIEQDIPEESRWSVEFGAGDGVTLPLTCEPLIRREGWRSLLIDGDQDKIDVLVLRVPESAKVVCGLVNAGHGSGESTLPWTIDDYMLSAGCPGSPALMVIDVDSIDYHIAATMRATPYILCIEHMDLECPHKFPGAFVPRVEDSGKILEGGFGLQANAEALDATIPASGYTLVFRTRVNSVYVRNDVAQKIARVPDEKIRINIGAGDKNHPRYTPVDIKDGKDARKLEYADGSVAEVYSSHLLEHFSHKETDAILSEWARVIEPGGIMRISVPDAKKIAERIVACEDSGDFAHLEMILCGAQSDANDLHRAAFTEKKLAERMYAAGIGNIRPFHSFVPGDCSNNPLSVNLMGEKRWWPKIEKPRVCLVLCQPRLAFTGHEARMIDLAKKLDFDIEISHGAFWERDMSCTTIRAISAHDPDFLLYSDYDSLPEVEQVAEMLETINSNPTMAALGAVQMSRHNDEPLVFDRKVDHKDIVQKVTFQHFGLTFIRREVFDELPQPWFFSVPGKDAKGNWDWSAWSRSDGDITFWRNLHRMGFNVFQHNGMVIGHIIQAVKYPRDAGKGVQLIPLENYLTVGKPRDANFSPDIYRAKDKKEEKKQ